MKPYGLPPRPLHVCEARDERRAIQKSSVRFQLRSAVASMLSERAADAEQDLIDGHTEDTCPGCSVCPCPCDGDYS
jgi:hypothetical protein